MFKLNFKIAMRNLLRNKTVSLINISGLAIGLASCLMLMLYVSYEWRYDKQFKNASNIYQVMVNFYGADKNIVATGDQTGNTLAATLKDEMPEVAHVGRILWESKRLLANGKNTFKFKGRYADPEILKIFDYQYINGSPDKALSDPNSIILTESTAKRLFGSTDVLNNTLRFENQANLKVTAVIKDLPPNTTYNFECLVPWKLFENLNQWVLEPNWHNYSFYTLLTLKKDADVTLFNQKIKNTIRKHAPSKVTEAEPFAYPLTETRLSGSFVNGKPEGGGMVKVKIFISLALGILIIACINFMNLATARSQKRAKEVGIKKTIGASRKSLILQFLMESLILTTVSVIIAVIFVELALPKFNSLLDIKLEMVYSNPTNWLVVLLVILLTGLLAGSYPAFFLSSFSPVKTLKKSVSLKNNFSLNLRQVLVVVQFSFAVVLIIATLIIYSQLQHVKNKPMGYNANALIEMPHEGNLYPKFDLLKERLLKSGAVVAVCKSSASISAQNSNTSGVEWKGMSQSDLKVSFSQIFTTYDFIKTNGAKLLEGREFKKEFASDSTAILLSKTAASRMGLKNPIGENVVFQGVKRHVVGVFEDIIWGDPAKRERPMIIAFNQDNTDVITMRLNAEGSMKDHMETVSQITKDINPDFPVDIKFLNVLMQEKFQEERTLALLSNLFGGLSIFISCMGLFGLSAFSAEQRTKEIGVRKVLGASVTNIIKLLSISFIRTVILALVIGLPIAYFVMNSWLTNFDYRTTITWWQFALAAGCTLLIAFLTVSWQAYRAAKTNPVDALKYE